MEEKEDGKPGRSTLARIRGWRRFLYLEPAVFFYFLGNLINITLITQYVYYRLAQQYSLPPDYILDSSVGCDAIKNANNSMSNIEDKVQGESAFITMLISISTQTPAIFVSLLFGAWTDKNGRRPALILPVIGLIVHCTIQLLVMYLNLSLYILILSNFINGCCGSIPLALQTGYAYISDVTTQKNRIFRLAVMQSLIYVASVLGYILAGLAAESLGFLPPVWIVFASEVTCLLYIMILPESRSKVPDASGFFSTQSFKAMWSVYRKPRKNGGRKLLILFTVINCLLWMAIVGIDSVMIIFLLATPLCFSSSIIGYVYSLLSFSMGFGAIIFTWRPFLRRVGELNMTYVGIVSTGLAFGWLTFCDRRWMVYLVPVLGFAAGAVDPIMKGWDSKIASEEEQGAMFAAITATEAIAIVIGSAIFNSLYSVFVKIGSGEKIFLMAGGLALIPFPIIYSVRKHIAAVEKKQSKEACNNNASVSTENERESFINKRQEEKEIEAFATEFGKSEPKSDTRSCA